LTDRCRVVHNQIDPRGDFRHWRSFGILPEHHADQS
jgi:hypothetical protein